MAPKLSIFQMKLLAWIFEALLPPDEDADHNNYYEVLEVSKKATGEEIRRAYKKKSLRFHPDKIAQKNLDADMTQQEIDRRFQEVKEAYETLSDDEKRKVYDALGALGVQVLNNPSSVMDPSTVSHNLSQASCMNKSKLFFLVLLSIGILLCLPILVCAKIDQTLAAASGGNTNVDILANTKWVLILIPLWVMNVFAMILLLSAKAWISIVSLICLFVQEVFLALKWDRTISWSYVVVLIPLYCHQLLKVIEALFFINKVHSEVRKMTTVEYLEKHHLNNSEDAENGTRKYEDLNDEEKDQLSKEFIIVHVPPEGLDAIATDDDEANLFMQILSSPEYQLRMEILDSCYHTLATVILFRLAFLVLLVLKLDDNKDWDWFLVFVPVWLEIAYNMLPSCWICCCSCFFAPVTDTEFENSSTKDEHKDDLADEFHMEGPEHPDNVSKQPKETSPSKSSTNIPQSEFKVEQQQDNTTINNTQAFNNDSNPTESSYPGVSPLYAREDMNAPSIPKNTETAKQHASMNREDCGSDYTEDNHRGKDDWGEEHTDEVEAQTMEKQAKAFGSCCFQVLLCIFLSLFLVKLNTADSFNHKEGTDPGYSSFWIAFPLFFFSGLILCVCCCTIYSGVETDSFGAMGKKKSEETEDPVVIVTPPPPTTTVPPPTTAATTVIAGDPLTVESFVSPAKPTENIQTPKTETTALNLSSFYDDDLD